MDGAEEYLRLIVKEMWGTDFLDPADLKAKGYGAIKAVPGSTSVPHGTKRALPGDYAYAWQVSICTPATLVKTGHAATDYTLMMIVTVHKILARYLDAQDRYGLERETMSAEAEDFRVKYDAAYQTAQEAKHKVQLQARYLRNLQTQAKRALEDYRGNLEEREKEKHEWNCAITFAARMLYDKGLAYADVKAKYNALESWRVKKSERLGVVMHDDEKMREQLRLHVKPDFQYLLGKVAAVLKAMKDEKGEDESEWCLNEEVETIIKEIEQHFIDMGSKWDYDLSFDGIWMTDGEEDDGEDDDEEEGDEEEGDEEEGDEKEGDGEEGDEEEGDEKEGDDEEE